MTTKIKKAAGVGATVSVVTSTALMGMVVSAPPAQAYALGCENVGHQIQWFNFDKASYSVCMELWGDGRTVDNIHTWFDITHWSGIERGEMPPTDIRYVMNFDYFVAPGVVGHTDTIRSPFYTVDCSTDTTSVCFPPNSPPLMWNGRFHWGDWRPDVLGQNKGYGQVCTIVEWKTSPNDTWAPLTSWKCFRVGD